MEENRDVLPNQLGSANLLTFSQSLWRKNDYIIGRNFSQKDSPSQASTSKHPKKNAVRQPKYHAPTTYQKNSFQCQHKLGHNYKENPIAKTLRDSFKGLSFNNPPQKRKHPESNGNETRNETLKPLKVDFQRGDAKTKPRHLEELSFQERESLDVERKESFGRVFPSPLVREFQNPPFEGF